MFLRLRNKCYLCIGWCLFGIDMKLNLMISHRLADYYFMADSFSFAMIYFRAFALFVRTFCLRVL
jgi:hypothetical protein